jgi:antirestriction protein ArdC
MATKKKATRPKKSTAERALVAIAPIVEALERGDSIPWRKPWHPGAMHVGANDRPYAGGNQFVAGLIAAERGYESRRWWTYSRIMEAGGATKKVVKFPNGGSKTIYSGGDYSVAGTKGKWVTVFGVFRKKWTEQDDETGEETTRFGGWGLSTYSVLNLDEVTGMPDSVKYPDSLATPANPDTDTDCIESYMAVRAGWDAPNMRHYGDRAYYTPKSDSLTMPKIETFLSNSMYVRVLAHEDTHSTGHSSRLSRVGVTDPSVFGTERYAYEELVAEIGAAGLCGLIGVNDPGEVENSAAYCQSWHKRISDDPVAFIRAMQQGVRAVQYMMGEAPDYSSDTAAEVAAA